MELSAFAAVGGEFRFLITNAETRATSGWLSIGDSFEEHRIRGFHVTDEILTVEHAGESIPLRLKQDKVEQRSTFSRRLLSYRGDAERRKREIPIWIDGYGNVALGPRAVTFDEIEALFRRLTGANAIVEIIFVHRTLAPDEDLARRRATKEAVLGRAQEAGLKVLRSRYFDVERGR